MNVISGKIATSYPNLYNSSQPLEKPKLYQAEGHLPRPEVHRDLLEISEEARRIAADITHEAVKVTIPDRPAGAPEDYVAAAKLMEFVHPETYGKMTEAFAQGDIKSGLSQLLEFVRNIPAHPEWMENYKKNGQQPTI
ncbi:MULTISPECIES: hypothetical protein [Paenibacillus]|uniref:hypothetical protein n=1 Tax=Paenibacillus TaxID=44249 RepID=UPI00073F213A|nr:MULTISPECIES: hypothetical protein [Paenibacillus]MDU4698091.1 hypothetical protein [Paenibacillus sp.]